MEDVAIRAGQHCQYYFLLLGELFEADDTLCLAAKICLVKGQTRFGNLIELELARQDRADGEITESIPMGALRENVENNNCVIHADVRINQDDGHNEPHTAVIVHFKTAREKHLVVVRLL